MKRYQNEYAEDEMVECGDGVWVRYEDHEAEVQAAGKLLGTVCCIGTLAKGEHLAENPGHAAVTTALNLRERAEKAEARVEELEAAQEWVDSSIELPDSDRLVLVVGEIGRTRDYMVARYADKWWSGQYGWVSVSHWMPLPDKPRSKRDGQSGQSDKNRSAGLTSRETD